MKNSDLKSIFFFATLLGVTLFASAGGTMTDSKRQYTVAYGSYVTEGGKRHYYGCSISAYGDKNGSIVIPANLFGIASGYDYYFHIDKIVAAGFADQSGISDILFPDEIITIQPRAFKNCTSLTNITFGNSLTTIGYGAFQNCSKLTSITLPSCVTNIDAFQTNFEPAFRGCTSLSKVTFLGDVPCGVVESQILAYATEVRCRKKICR